MSTIILHKLLSLNHDIFRDLSLSMTKFQPSVAYKSVAYKRKSVYTVMKQWNVFHSNDLSHDVMADHYTHFL